MTASLARLDGKVAIVTGASSGIGRAIAKLLAAQGAHVGARRRALLDELVAEVAEGGGRALAVAGDISDESYAGALVNTATAQFGGLDIAVNNAGTLGPMGPTLEVTPEVWNATIATNLTSAFFAARYQLPAMLARGRGSLLFVSSFIGYTAARCPVLRPTRPARPV